MENLKVGDRIVFIKLAKGFGGFIVAESKGLIDIRLDCGRILAGVPATSVRLSSLPYNEPTKFRFN